MKSQSENNTGNEIQCIVLCHIIGVVYLYFLYCIRNISLLADEGFHTPYISRIIAGDFTFPSYLTVPPTYHYLIAGIAKLFSFKSIAALRMVNMLIGLLCVFVFYKMVKITSPKSKYLKTFQFAFFPIIFPFHFLNYTDIASLLFVMLSTLMAMSSRPILSGAFGFISLLIRQTNIFWVFYNYIVVSVDFYKSKKLIFSLSRFRDYSTFLLSGGLFFLFYIFNDGFSLGDKATQKLTFNLANVWFLLILFGVLFPHDCIRAIWSNRSRLCGFKLLSTITILSIIFWNTYEITCSYNHIHFYARNQFLIWSTTYFYGKAIALFLFIFGFLGLFYQNHNKYSNYLIFLIASLSVVFLPLIEIRYYFPFFTLYLVFRTDDHSKLNVIVSIVYFSFSVYFMLEIMKKSFFL